MSKRRKYNANKKFYPQPANKEQSAQTEQTKATESNKSGKPAFNFDWKALDFTPIKKIFALSDSNAVSISSWALLTKPFTLLADNFKMLIIGLLPTAFLMTLYALITKRGVMCSVDSTSMILSPYCSDSTLAFGANIIVQLAIISLFIIKWYQFALQKRPLTFKIFKHTNIALFKLISVLITFIFLNLMPLLALGVLLLHTPYPDWRAELVFFTLFAWMFLMPILAVRFYSVVAFVFEGQPIPSLHDVWKRTTGNMLKLLLSFSAITFLALLFGSRYMNNVHMLPEMTFATAFMAEYGFNLLTLIFACLWANHCYMQKKLLYPEN